MPRPHQPHLKKARECFGGELENQSLFGVGASPIKKSRVQPLLKPIIGCIGCSGCGSSQAKKVS
ncbi:MAG TPA: hypothetical protein VK077_08830 [Virgibacillus sp.]|nr:hypothetical protein [Virgibacillus sp.]